MTTPIKDITMSPRASSTLIRVLCQAGILLALAGCQRSVALDASSHDALNASLKAMSSATPAATRKEFDAAVSYFDQQYFKAGGPDATLPDWHAVQGMDRAEFLHFVDVIKGVLAPPVALPPDAPDPEVTRRYLESLELQHDLLVERRDQAHSDGHYTVDQFQWANPFFTPPAPDAPVLTSEATFILNFTNHTAFNVYPPTLHLTIMDPDKGIPVFDEDLEYVPEPKKKTLDKVIKAGFGWSRPDPIPSNSPTLLRYVCCQLLKRPEANNLMQHLPKDAQFEYSITAVEDYTQQDQLDHTTYTSRENGELNAADQCIADIKARRKTWTPATAIPACRAGREHDTDDN